MLIVGDLLPQPPVNAQKDDDVDAAAANDILCSTTFS